MKISIYIPRFQAGSPQSVQIQNTNSIKCSVRCHLVLIFNQLQRYRSKWSHWWLAVRWFQFQLPHAKLRVSFLLRRVASFAFPGQIGNPSSALYVSFHRRTNRFFSSLLSTRLYANIASHCSLIEYLMNDSRLFPPPMGMGKIHNSLTRHLFSWSSTFLPLALIHDRVGDEFL